MNYANVSQPNFDKSRLKRLDTKENRQTNFFGLTFYFHTLVLTIKVKTNIEQVRIKCNTKYAQTLSKFCNAEVNYILVKNLLFKPYTQKKYLFQVCVIEMPLKYDCKVQ